MLLLLLCEDVDVDVALVDEVPVLLLPLELVVLLEALLELLSPLEVLVLPTLLRLSI